MKKNISYKRKSKSKQNLKYKGGGIFSRFKKIEQLDQCRKSYIIRGKPSSEEKSAGEERARSRRK